MAELALGAVGVVPIIGLAIKSFQTLCTEVKTFRHCNDDVRRLHKRLKRQRHLFENECELLLRGCLGDEVEIREMVTDPNHKGWEDQKKDRSLKKLLKVNYDACEELVQDILEAVKKLESKLACFQAVKPKQQKGEKIKDTWKRVSDGMKLCFNKSDYESDLDELKSANSELSMLREQVTQLQKPCKTVTMKRAAIPQGWSEIRRAAKALYEALIGAWSCRQASHLRHFVKLFLEAEKADEDVHMDIAIMCHGYRRSPGGESLIQLQVRSAYVEWRQSPRLFVPSCGENGRPKKRIKSVRFSEGCSTTCTITQAPTASCTVQHEADASSDLRASRDFCSELMTSCSQKQPRCLGHLYVRSDSNLRHSFYPHSTTTCGNPSVGALLPMDAFLHSTGDLFSTADRLRMARSLVLAVLKFYATPWLSDAWRLGDFSLFHSADVGNALRTLHLGVEVTKHTFSMDDIQPTQPGTLAEEQQLMCGIENMTLHSLGVALLQIDRMQKMEIDDVVGVRKVARMRSSFGRRYQEITLKCLGCDFGFGADLGKGRLQRAVYDELIGPLEDMISSLSLEDED